MQEKRHKFGDWRHLELNGRIRKRATQNPARERLMVRHALLRLRYRSREAVPFMNKYYKDGTVQWLDFVVQMPNKKLFVILFGKRQRGGWMKRELDGIKAKEKFLVEKGIPYIVIPRGFSSREYEIRILMMVRKEIYDTGKHAL